MGDQVAELTYGVLINPEDYEKLESILYERGKEKWSLKEINDKSTIAIKQPYETEDFIVYVRSIDESAGNGTSIINSDFFSSKDTDVLDDLINDFLKQHDVKAKSKIGWLLTAHYG